MPDYTTAPIVRPNPLPEAQTVESERIPSHPAASASTGKPVPSQAQALDPSALDVFGREAISPVSPKQDSHTHRRWDVEALGHGDHEGAIRLFQDLATKKLPRQYDSQGGLTGLGHLATAASVAAHSTRIAEHHAAAQRVNECAARAADALRGGEFYADAHRRLAAQHAAALDAIEAGERTLLEDPAGLDNVATEVDAQRLVMSAFTDPIEVVPSDRADARVVAYIMQRVEASGLAPETQKVLASRLQAEIDTLASEIALDGLREGRGITGPDAYLIACDRWLARQETHAQAAQRAPFDEQAHEDYLDHLGRC